MKNCTESERIDYEIDISKYLEIDISKYLQKVLTLDIYQADVKKVAAIIAKEAQL